MDMVYVRMRNRIQVFQGQEILVKDTAKLIGPENIVKNLEQILLKKVEIADQNIIVIDLVHMIGIITKNDPSIEIQSIGPAQTIVEVIIKKKEVSIIAFSAVWLLLFIGAAITIMNFHEDVSMRAVHQHLYKMITGKNEAKPLLIQIPYSFGLGIGMILFFNHFFRKRFNEEPSPLEVEMFNYQQDLDQYVIMNENEESTRNLNDR
ncbi:stage V sporulation protein AA [Bacillus sp. MUM 13]|uniref:stage V sporulation protein AA n=1 Tax=Bacillus sp. MUM 13 TaxID=1678001 RepID=UPI0008F572E2|nr:stage V sporulation protein AA [Bacillus sp. MUM 13]OIK13623.1 stage V sporulation protein AA [Bacillus sp. MUM 13]